MTVATFIDGNHPVLDRCIEPAAIGGVVVITARIRFYL